MPDLFEKKEVELESPYENGFPILPNSTVYFSQTTRGIYVGLAGNVVVELASSLTDSNSAPLTFYNVPAGSFLRVRAKKVFANSTANLMIGLY